MNGELSQIGVTRISAGWMIDGTGDPARHHVEIQIDRGRIASIRRARPDEVLYRSKAAHLDLSHCTILPGMVDCHVHLSMSGTNDQEARQEQLRFSYEQAEPVISRHIEQHLTHGVVALRDGGDSAGHTLRYLTNGASLRGYPVILKAAGKAWRARGRYGRLIGRPPAEGLTLAQCIERQELEADHVKIINSGLNSLKEFGKQTAPQFSFEQLERAFRAARGRGWRTMVHANGELPVQLAIDAGCSSIEHGFFMGRENMERIAGLQVFWAPTAFSMKAYCRELDPQSQEAQISARNLDHQLAQIAFAREAGARIVVGTDSGGLGIHHGRSFTEELRLLVEAGLGVEEAVRCATLEGARLLGIEHKVGQLKAGMPASLIAVPASPTKLLEALSSPVLVLIEGRIVLDRRSCTSCTRRCLEDVDRWMPASGVE